MELTQGPFDSSRIRRGFKRGRQDAFPSDWVGWFLSRTKGVDATRRNLLIRTNHYTVTQGALWRCLDLVKSAKSLQDRERWLDDHASADIHNLTQKARFVRQALFIHDIFAGHSQTRWWMQSQVAGVAPARWPGALHEAWNMAVPPTPWELGAFMATRPPAAGKKFYLPVQAGYCLMRWWLIGMTVKTLASALGVDESEVRTELVRFVRWYRESLWFYWAAASGWSPMFVEDDGRDRMIAWLDGRRFVKSERPVDLRWLDALKRHPYWKVAQHGGFAGDVRLRTVFWPWYYPATWGAPTDGFPDYSLRIRVVDRATYETTHEGLVDRRSLLGSPWRASAWTTVPKRNTVNVEEEEEDEQE